MRLKRFTTQLIAAGLIALPLAAHAAGLGKLSVKSALGQPLAAEIEVFAADKEELESLVANLASDQAFREARVEYAPVLSTLRFDVLRKEGNKAVLKVTSTRPVNDPFVDFLVELNWTSGRLVREYTLLLDPPGVATEQVIAPAAPAVKAPPAAKATPAPAPAVAAKAPAAPRAPAAAPAGAPDSVVVKRGDTLAGIARRVRPEGVSLEQTLVGLYRENTKAFEGNNMNRLRAGAKLNVPGADKLAALSQQDANREIRLQAADWRAYRQKLAEAVSAAPETAAEAAPGQAASGQITAKVDDRAKPAPGAQKDVLTLSKGAPAAGGDAAALQEKLRAQEEDALARERALQESNERVAMLEKQVQDMQELVRMKEEALENGAAQPQPEAAPPAAAPKVDAPAPAPAEKWYDPLLANPLYWGGGAAIVGLGGLLWWMMAGGARRRKNPVTLDDSIMSGGDIRPNTVVGAASGGAVNTGDTSFLTDFSQAGLGTIDTHDVDPIAEAEVYMAYGRDAQAEEILKEAIIKTPDRHEIRVKLLEIYAARRNTAAFETAAGDLYAALGGKPSPLWDRVCEMGRSIDPTNPLYGGGGGGAAPAATTVAATAAIAGGAVAMGSGAEAAAPAEPFIADLPEPQPAAADNSMDFESAGNILQFESGSAPAAEAAPAEKADLDFDLSGFGEQGSADELKLDLGVEPDNGPDSAFNFGDLDLDLGESGGSDLELDEVSTKLDLARAYLEMGDRDGAREILNEVIAEGNDRQKADATGMLSALG